MAVVLAPRYAKRYNFNPRGSATATVAIAGRNPFEGGVPVRMKAPTSFLPLGMYHDNMPFGGMNGLGEGEPTAAAPAASSWWGGLLPGITNMATTVGTQLLSGKINKMYPPPETPIPTTGMQQLSSAPVATLPVGQQYYPPAPAAAPSKMPMILIGVGVVGLLAVFLMKRK